MSKLPENNLRGASATVGASGKVAADRSDDGGRSDSTTENSAGTESRVEAAALGISAGEHRCEVLTNGWDDARGVGVGAGPAVLKVDASGVGTAAGRLRTNATLVLACSFARPEDVNA